MGAANVLSLMEPTKRVDFLHILENISFLQGMTTAAGNFSFTYRGENEVLLGCFPEKLFFPSYGRHRDGFSMKSDVLKHRSVLTYFPCIVREEPDIKRNKFKNTEENVQKPY